MNAKDFMLCHNINEEESRKLDVSRWKANYKWDGERIIAIVDKGEVILLNRRGNIKNEQFKEVVEELKQLPDCILDGEVISKDNNFNRLQSRAGTKDASSLIKKASMIPIDYMIFDLLRVESEMLIAEQLKDRVKKLNALFNGRDNFNHLKLCEYGEISTLLQIAKDKVMEGIIVKDMEARYEGRRSRGWLKLKLWKETTIMITKYTANPAGIRVEADDGTAVQVSGAQSIPVKNKLDAGQEVAIYIQYLERTKENKYRFPSYRGMVE